MSLVYTVTMWQSILAINLFNNERFKLAKGNKVYTCNGEPLDRGAYILVSIKGGAPLKMLKDAQVYVWNVEGK